MQYLWAILNGFQDHSTVADFIKTGDNTPKLAAFALKQKELTSYMNEATGPERKTKRQLQEVAIFNDVAKALTSSLNLDSILQTIMDKMAEFFRPDTWSLLMVDEQKDELYFAIAVGDAAETLKTVRLKVGEGIAGWVARHGESLIVPDVYNDPRFAKRIDEMTKWKTRSIICVPLQSKHRVLGVIQLINCAMESFGEQEMFFLHALCDYAAIAIDNARAVEKIQELTITDDCTGLYNARHLYKTLESEVYRSARFGYEFSVIFLDLDHFKYVNDTYGHLVGSKLLQEIGFKIKSQLRLIDYAFRYGGDEFVILLPQTDKQSALVVAKRIQDMMRKTIFLAEDGLNLQVRCSMGLATYPEDAKSSHEIIRQADEMMYMVKNSSRDNIAVAQLGVLK
ncbi:MAG TPA: sensor domain-containing diguanylate cyclase [Candidatus Angelobacter sp.]|nr:sensor domain-containing diguanylate cyclase [Candidatus Angelobacter sp.]